MNSKQIKKFKKIEQTKMKVKSNRKEKLYNLQVIKLLNKLILKKVYHYVAQEVLQHKEIEFN